MISRAHGLVLSLLLGTASAVGAFAVIGTAKLGNAETKPEVVSARQIATRAQKLDAWEIALRKALAAKPPALPALNRYAAETFVAAPGAASLPAPAPVPNRAVQTTQPAPAAKRAPKRTVKAAPKRVKVVAPVSRVSDRRESDSHDDSSERETTVPAPVPAPTPTPVAVASAPEPQPAAPVAAPPSVQPSAPPATLSVEQQCRDLLRAAEGKSEQAKKDAERQCEALKQAAERKR